MTTISEIVKAISGLSREQRTELIEKISGCEITSDANRDQSKIDLIAAAKDALAPVPGRKVFSPLMCAAANPENIARLRRLKRLCAQAGYELRDDVEVSMFDLDKALGGKPEAWVIKTEMARLRLIP
jgi:hypothetical protein